MYNILHAARRLAVVALGATLVLVPACERSLDHLEPVQLSTDPVVFDDALSPGVDFQAFLGSKLDALSVDTAERHGGSASLRVVIPAAGDPSGAWSGGAFPTRTARNLSGYNALVFWAKASRDATLDIVGLGNDNTGTSKYEASWEGIALTTQWQRYVLPVPLPEKLSAERGLFFFADNSGAEGDAEYTIWFDDIAFANVGGITNPRPELLTRTVSTFVGANVEIVGTQTTFSVEGTDELVRHSPRYFTYVSSADSVARSTGETVRVVGPGSATVTALLGNVPATGEVTVIAGDAPTTPAPVPTHPAADVISLFSNAYSNISVDTWSASWDMADVTDFRIAGDDVKAYTNLVFAGIEWAQNDSSRTLDLTNYTHLHIDIWVPAGVPFVKIKLVDFGADGVYQGAPDSERELTFNDASTPPLVTGQWASLEIPLDDFMFGPNGLFSRAHVAQMLISASNITAFVDNVYFHR